MLAFASIWSRYVKDRFGQAARINRRRSAKCRSRASSRSCAAAEVLEERALLCSAAGIEPSSLLGVGVGNDAHASHESDHALPPGLKNLPPQSETHYINGVPFEFTWDALPAGADEATQSAVATSEAVYPLSSIPELHSNAGANVKLFLDFDGHFEPVWGSYSNVTTAGYDIDGDPLTFSDTELANIEALWFRVAEDFAPFKLDVTTVEPAVLAAGVPIDQANGVALRVAIGGTDFTGLGYAGVAAYDAFTNSIANVVYAFSPSANVASHEAGHAFGLYHQSTYDAYGNKLLEYNPGDFKTWTPIMGPSMWSTIIQTWHNGTSTSATTFQDDMAVIAGPTNGFGYRADDHADTTATATPLSQAGDTWSAAGLVGANTDVDMFSFVVTTEDTYRITASGLPGLYGDLYASNLDAALELRNSAGAVIATANPSGTTSAELRKGLTPGTYFVGVKSSGVYGWVGQYTVNIDTPLSGITVTPASTVMTTGEDGRQASFSVALQTQPTADVVISISSTNTAEGTVSTGSWTFTAANWDVPQVVTVTGVGDGVIGDDVAYSVTIGAAVSGDAEYAGLDPADIPVVNLENDAPGLVYYVDFNTDMIRRTRLSGSQPETVADLKTLYTNVTPQNIAIDLARGKLYWTDVTANRIQRANLDGTTVETVVSGGVGFGGLTLDAAAGKLYWVNSAAGKIQRANLDGSAIEDLVTGLTSGARGIAVDPAAGKMYWADSTPHLIQRANLDGTSVEVLWTGATDTSPYAVALDTSAGKLYWSDTNQDLIRRSNLDGTNVEVVVNTAALVGLSQVLGLALDVPSGKMYWSDNITQTLYRANLDGSMIAALAPGQGPRGLAIAQLAPGISVTPGTQIATTEDGGSAAFRVSLTTQPTANVTIALGNGDPSEGTLSTSSLTFTPANWNITQTVTVTGVADSLFDGDIPYTITLAPAVSSDPVYSAINPRDVSVINREKAALTTKFFVVDDASQNKTYEYNAAGGLVESYNVNSGNSAPRGAASALAGDKIWVVDANRKVYVYNTSGGLLGSWTAGTLANNATVEGIAVSPNGADVWIVDARSDKVFFYAGAGSRLSGSQTATSSFSLNSGNTSPKDIVTDGVSLWVVNDSTTNKVFKYTVPGTLSGSWTIDPANSRPTGLTIDPFNVGNIWIVDSGTDRIYQYNAATSRTSGNQTAVVSYALAAGNTNPQGIADPPTSAAASAFSPVPEPAGLSPTTPPGEPARISTADIDSLFATLAANFTLTDDDETTTRRFVSRKTLRQRLHV